ncbi:unnamed protein product [Ilex paraguariensis]|uniref:K-box domain-containing protein n=1 Tax=Ilex paraguariensis TaxID=185542 RepID=A0ABC8V015_9AQUA
MKDTLAKYKLQNKLEKVERPCLELQMLDTTQNSDYISISKEFADKSHQMRQLMGEDLLGLNLEELQQLEKMLELGQTRVLETKGERITNEIAALQRKGDQLREENRRLKQQVRQSRVEEDNGLQMVMISEGNWRTNNIITDQLDNLIPEGGQSPESVTNVSSCNSGPPREDYCSDTSLKLGLPFN